MDIAEDANPRSAEKLDAEHLARIETSTTPRWLVLGIVAGAASGAAVAGYFGGVILIGGLVGAALGAIVYCSAFFMKC